MYSLAVPVKHKTSSILFSSWFSTEICKTHAKPRIEIAIVDNPSKDGITAKGCPRRCSGIAPFHTFRPTTPSSIEEYHCLQNLQKQAKKHVWTGLVLAEENGRTIIKGFSRYVDPKTRFISYGRDVPQHHQFPQQPKVHFTGHTGQNPFDYTSIVIGVDNFYYAFPEKKNEIVMERFLVETRKRRGVPNERSIACSCQKGKWAVRLMQICLILVWFKHFALFLQTNALWLVFTNF